jgi:tRNA-splicing ligase RtcB
MEGVWYDYRFSDKLRDEAPSAYKDEAPSAYKDEAPSAYKDVRAVLRAQRELVKVTRSLRPILNYKGV